MPRIESSEYYEFCSLRELLSLKVSVSVTEHNLTKSPLLMVMQVMFWRRIRRIVWYDAVSDVVESGGVEWRSDFQICSRVLKICFKTILMHIYCMQYDFMHRSCWNHSNFENSLFYNVISTSEPQNHCLLGSRNRVAVNFLNRYVIYWEVPCERARPELSEYVWQRGVGSL